ncbi:MAG: DUF2795 domain-containing protein [Chloroflexi bacterium]|nr:DUF2795 domain-containing protein [Chloroflexota bacterium]
MQERPSRPTDPQPFRFGATHVAECLADVHFPQDREGLLRHARTRGAAADVLEFLSRLPDWRYESLDQVLGTANTLEEAA